MSDCLFFNPHFLPDVADCFYPILCFIFLSFLSLLPGISEFPMSGIHISISILIISNCNYNEWMDG